MMETSLTVKRMDKVSRHGILYKSSLDSSRLAKRMDKVNTQALQATNLKAATEMIRDGAKVEARRCSIILMVVLAIITIRDT